MKITKGRLRQIIREEVSRLGEVIEPTGDEPNEEPVWFVEEFDKWFDQRDYQEQSRSSALGFAWTAFNMWLDSNQQEMPPGAKTPDGGVGWQMVYDLTNGFESPPDMRYRVGGHYWSTDGYAVPHYKPVHSSGAFPAGPEWYTQSDPPLPGLLRRTPGSSEHD